MAFDLDGNFFVPKETFFRILPPELQTCGRCVNFSRYSYRDITLGFAGTCDKQTSTRCLHESNNCSASKYDGTSAFVPLEDLSDGWVYTRKK